VGTYSESFKRKMVQRLLLPNGPTANALAKETQVSQSTLSRWLRSFGTVEAVSNDNEGTAGRPRRPEDWTAEERLRAVTEAGRLDGEELGQFLRREGLHEETLEEWREAALDALQPSRPRSRGSDKKRLAKLEKELARKDKALAAANAVVELQKKKVHAILADADDDTNQETDE
jgi:transposase